MKVLMQESSVLNGNEMPQWHSIRIENDNLSNLGMSRSVRMDSSIISGWENGDRSVLYLTNRK